jgi:hypothetical protein
LTTKQNPPSFPTAGFAFSAEPGLPSSIGRSTQVLDDFWKNAAGNARALRDDLGSDLADAGIDQADGARRGG